MMPTSSVLAVLALTAALVSPLGAQDGRQLRVRLAAGFSQDVRSNFEGKSEGRHGVVTLEIGSYGLGARVDFMYQRFGSRRDGIICPAFGPCPEWKSRNEVLGLTLSGIKGVSSGTVRPYLIGGAGAYLYSHRRETRSRPRRGAIVVTFVHRVLHEERATGCSAADPRLRRSS